VEANTVLTLGHGGRRNRFGNDCAQNRKLHQAFRSAELRAAVDQAGFVPTLPSPIAPPVLQIEVHFPDYFTVSTALPA
jgi:hypothetical protein